MKPINLLLIISFLTLFGCEEIDKDCPDCILKKTKEFAKTATCYTGSSVSEWLFQGQSVFLFSDGNCGADLGASVYSQNCESLGYLGGFAGNTKINGIEFSSNATMIRTIWEQD